MERALHDARQVGRAIDAVYALAEGPVNLELVRILVEVELLMRVAAVEVRRHVAGDHDHRNRIERGVGDTGRRVRQPRAEVRQQDARLPRRSRVAVGGMRGDLRAAWSRRMRFLPMASRNAMFVWPQAKITSTPRRSR